MLAIIGHDSTAELERYGTSARRLAVADELDALVAEWIAAHDRDHVLAAFVDARVPIAPVNDVRDLLDDPHLAARGDLERLHDGQAPDLDAHHAEVLRNWLDDTT